MKKSNIIFLVLLIACVSYADAAMIRGNLYDISLNSIDKVIVEVNSTPKQTWVSKDGSYAFSLSQGSYKIQAFQKSGIEVVAQAEENIDITGDGEFFLDLVLFPDLGQSGIDDITPGVNLNSDKNNELLFIYIVAAVILFFIIGLLIRFFNVKKNARKSVKKAGVKVVKKIKEKPETKIDTYDSNQIITILKKHGGRATQKDIRKEIPLSEAKISLMVAELESKGKIKKIKKGRGNIIILN